MALSWSAAMFRRNPFSGLLIAFFSVLLWAVAAYASPQEAASSKLFGVVRDSAGHPVSGAHVLLTPIGSSETQATVTDGEGKFSLNLPNRGTYTLRVHKDAY